MTKKETGLPNAKDKSQYINVLNETPGNETTTDNFITESIDGTPKPKQIANTALHLDRWDLRRGRELLAESGRIQRELLGDGNEGKLNQVPNEQVQEAERTAADFHAACFQFEPTLHEEVSQETKLRRDFLHNLMETNEYASLHQQTMLREMESELATMEITEQYIKLKKEEEQEEQQKDTEPGNEKDNERHKFWRYVKQIGAAARAAERAKKEIEDFHEMCDTMGLGGTGATHGHIDMKKAVQLFQSIKNNNTIRQILLKAGAYKRVAQARQKSKAKHGLDEVTSTTLNNDTAHMLPSELARFAVPELKLDAMRRFAERQMLCRHHRSIQKLGQGPIIVCIDESGSMGGNKIQTAKAIALSMGWIARYQKRWIVFVSFSGGTEGVLYTFPPNKTWDDDMICEWLLHFYGGGTDLDVPLDTLPTKYWPQLLEQGLPKGKTDVIFITDAIVHAPDKMIEKFNKWKKDENVRAISLIIGTGNAGDMAKVSDEWHMVNNLEIGQTAIDNILSI